MVVLFNGDEGRRIYEPRVYDWSALLRCFVLMGKKDYRIYTRPLGRYVRFMHNALPLLLPATVLTP